MVCWTCGLFCGLFFESAAEHFDIFRDLTVLNFQLFNAFDTMHDSGVVATAKTASDFGQRAACQLLTQKHIIFIQAYPYNFMDLGIYFYKYLAK